MNTLAEAATEKDVYLSEFNRLEKELARRGRPAVQRLRRAAIARFDELGFPTPRNEDWKFTSLAALTKVPFRPAEPAGDSLKATQLAHILGMDAACRLVFVGGYFVSELSAMSGLPAGAVIGSLATALDESSEIVETHLGRQARFEEHAFTAVVVSEHHATDDGYLPSPLVVASAMAARTKQIAISVAALLVPLYDPVKLAEDIAVLDHVSRSIGS